MLHGIDLFIRVGEISDSTSSATITWGSDVRIDGTNNIDGNSRLDICACGSSRVLFSWTRTSNDTRCGAATITAGNGVTDISASFPQLTGNGAFSNVAWDHSKDKGVVTYRDGNTSDYGMGRLVTLGASNACTVGSQVAFKTGSYERGWSTYNAKIQTILMQYQSGGGSGATNFIQANISGSTLTWVNDGQYNGGTDSYGQRIASWNAADFSQSGSYGYVSLNKTRASNNNGVMYTAIVVSSVSTLKNQSQYVGFAAQAYTNGQTATINTYGNLVTTLSGLTTSSLYYVQGDGTIGLSVDGTLSGYFISGTPVAGTALNGTTLLVRDPATRV